MSYDSQKIFLTVVLLHIAIGFQNCSKVDFTPASGGELVAKADSAGPGDTNNTETTPSPTPADPDEICVSDDDAGQVHGRGSSHEQGMKKCDDDKRKNPSREVCSEHRRVESEYRYVCVLEGPGESVKIGLNTAGALGTDDHNGTPDDVCMSAAACTDLVGKAFNVKGPRFRGFCPHKNKHVNALSDQEISDKIDKILDGE